MKRLSAFTLAVICTAHFIQAATSPNGFVVWSEGGHENRELKYIEIREGVGPVAATKKGSSEESVGALALQCRGTILQISDLMMVQAYSKSHASLSPYPSRDCSTPSPRIGGRLGWGV